MPSHPARTTVLFLLAALLLPAVARADTIKLKSGGTLYGKIESRDADKLRLRTPLGLVEIKCDDVASIEYGPPPWEEYDRLKITHPDTAEGQYRLALWCRSNGLEPQARKHFQRVIDLDPDHAGARKALGFRNEGDGWTKPGAAARSTAKSGKSAKPARAVITPEEKLLRELIAKWTVKVKTIYAGRLDNREPASKQFEDGRAQIMAIHDPLAIPAISSILSRGRHAAIRVVLVESLAQFKEDEATMNLVVVSLLDPDPMVRRKAAVALIDRKDKRIIPRLRKALSSNEDTVVRNAAVALDILHAREAVIDLATVLYTVERRNVRYARTDIIGDVYQAFNGQVLIPSGNQNLRYRPQVISVLSDGTAVGTTWVDEVQDVTVYRTDVQEALIHITGQNFGFDADAWINWARKHPPEP